MEFNIIGGSYESKYLTSNAQKTINWYIVNKTQTEDNKTTKALYPTPGLTAKWAITGTRVRGLYVVNALTSNRCFAVVDDTVYELNKDGSTTTIGTMTGTNCTQSVYMVCNTNNQLVIVDNGNTGTYVDSYLLVTNNGHLLLHTVDLSTNTLSLVSDIDIQPTQITAGRVYFSNSNDMTAWTGADVFTPTYSADATTSIITFQGDIYCFGKESLERYFNDGTTPFSRREGATLSYGLVAPRSVAVFANGIIFLGRSARGQAQVYLITIDNQIAPLSPHTITGTLGKAANIEECVGYIQETKDGHIWYYLHVPGLDTTLVYDSLNNEWHERKSTKPFSMANGLTEQGMFRGSCIANWDGQILVGDRYSGNIFLEDYNTFTENSLPIIRERQTVIYTEEYKTLAIGAFELDLSLGSDYAPITGQGSSPNLMFSITKNKGNTYYNERFIALDESNNPNIRTRLLGIGCSSQWGFNFKLSDPINCAIIGATIRGQIGAS